MYSRRIQELDREIVDYALFTPEGSGVAVRGPAPEPDAPFLVALGAGQAFGRFVAEPYPTLLARDLGLQVLNLSRVGVGPAHFLRRPALLALARRARLALVEVMSALMVDNSRVAVAQDGARLVDRTRPDDAPAPPEATYRALAGALPAAEFARLAAETQQAYLQEMRALIEALAIPTVLVSLSPREPAARLVDIADPLEGAYPFFVTEGVLSALSDHAAGSVHCTARKGVGEPVAADSTILYSARFPSPAMHAAAAEAVLPVARKALAGAPPASPRPRQRKVIVHHHFFKNAGSSVDEVLKRAFGPGWVECEPADFADRYENAFMTRVVLADPAVKAVSSHNLKPPVAVPGAELFSIVVLRHPVDRIRSAYDFEQLPNRGDQIHTRMSKALSFPDYIDWLLSTPPVQHSLINAQTRFLGLLAPWKTPDGDHGRTTEAHLLEAIDFVSRLPAVGIVDRFEETFGRIGSWLKPHFPELEIEAVRVNTTQREGSSLTERLAGVREALGPARYERLVAANALDLQLYAYAHERMGLAPMAEVV